MSDGTARAGTLGRAYAFAHAYRRDESREPAATRVGTWAALRIEDAPRLPLPAPALGLLDGVEVGPSVRAGPSPRPAPGPAARLTRLATLLHLNLGVVRVDLNHVHGHAIHRAIPSPSHLYPSELFAYVAGDLEVDEGIYHYDALRHDLGLVRGADARASLEAALDRSLATVDAVLLVSSVLWRLVQKYSNFAYRLASLEAGHLVGNLLATAGALGWHARVQYLFDDDRVEATLGLPRLSVATMAAVLLHRDVRDVHRGASRASAGAPARPGPIAGRWRIHPGGAEAAPRSGDVVELETAARAARAARPWRPPGHAWRPGPRVTVTPGSRPAGLLAAIRSRGSGNVAVNGIAIAPRTLTRESVAGVLAGVLDGHPSDLYGAGAPRVQVVAVANRVEGLAAGAYVWDGADGALCRVADSPLPAGALWYPELVDGRALSVIWALLVDYDAALDAHGDRGYRLANMEAGLVGQRISLVAAAEGLFARPFCAFDERVWDRWLGLAWGRPTTGYLVLAGADRLPPLCVEPPWPGCGRA